MVDMEILSNNMTFLSHECSMIFCSLTKYNGNPPPIRLYTSRWPFNRTRPFTDLWLTDLPTIRTSLGIFLILPIHNPRICHDLELRSSFQGQASVHTYKKSYPGHIFLLLNLTLITFRTIIDLNPRVCHKILSPRSCWISIMFHTIGFHDPRVRHDLNPRYYLQGQGDNAYIEKIIFQAKTHFRNVWFE